MKISPAKSINGTIELPGDKSISHRAAMIAAMANGRTSIDNFATGADCTSTLTCLADLGVEIRREGNSVFVRGVGKRGFSNARRPIDCGNSGTTMRLLAGILAGQPFESVLIGDPSLSKRPMGRIVQPLTEMGASILSENGTPPLTIRGPGLLRSIEYRSPVASAQLKSCVLLAGLNSDGVTTIVEPVKTRDHTERMLAWFGVNTTTEEAAEGSRVSLSGDAKLTARDVVVPGDISSAAFFIAAAVCLPGADLTLPLVCMNPTRTAFLDVLRDLGCRIDVFDLCEISNEPVASIRVRFLENAAKPAMVLRGRQVSDLIDEIPVLAVIGTQLGCGIEIRDATELRVKESDRIAAVVGNLSKMGATVTEYPDGFKVGTSRLTGANLDSGGDHRIAMAFAVAGLLAEGETVINGAECADISFPGFFELLQSVVR